MWMSSRLTALRSSTACYRENFRCIFYLHSFAEFTSHILHHVNIYAILTHMNNIHVQPIDGESFLIPSLMLPALVVHNLWLSKWTLHITACAATWNYISLSISHRLEGICEKNIGRFCCTSILGGIWTINIMYNREIKVFMIPFRMTLSRYPIY
jgi:hypothetical protein